MYWRNVCRGAAVCVAMGGVMPAVQAAVDPGFTVSGTASLSSFLTGGQLINQAAEWEQYVLSDYEHVVVETVQPQPGIPGKVETVSYHNRSVANYWEDYASYTVSSSDWEYHSGGYVLFSGVVDISPESVLYNKSIKLQVSTSADYKNAPNTLPPEVYDGPSCCGFVSPSYSIKRNGVWTPLNSFIEIFPGFLGNTEGGAFNSWTASADPYGVNSAAVFNDNHFEFSILAYVGGTARIGNITLGLSSRVELPLDETSVRTVLFSQETPALPVDEPSAIALLLAGGGIAASMARRRARGKNAL